MLKMKGINAMTTINAHRFGLVKVNLPTVVYDIRVAKKKRKKEKTDTQKPHFQNTLTTTTLTE